MPIFNGIKHKSIIKIISIIIIQVFLLNNLLWADTDSRHCNKYNLKPPSYSSLIGNNKSLVLENALMTIPQNVIPGRFISRLNSFFLAISGYYFAGITGAFLLPFAKIYLSKIIKFIIYEKFIVGDGSVQLIEKRDTFLKENEKFVIKKYAGKSHKLGIPYFYKITKYIGGKSQNVSVTCEGYCDYEKKYMYVYQIFSEAKNLNMVNKLWNFVESDIQRSGMRVVITDAHNSVVSLLIKRYGFKSNIPKVEHIVNLFRKIPVLSQLGFFRLHKTLAPIRISEKHQLPAQTVAIKTKEHNLKRLLKRLLLIKSLPSCTKQDNHRYLLVVSSNL